ncbi:cold-shock DNA-binding protein family [Cnuella takakiae]|uniref:Cold-shock DNA-binding protein family n=1 Tax=Cnuella takakiae TaxID=1302690 RepID=A0A1M4ZZZ7_9BACT|nr:cold shock domain-containing protein [Cnuella takakiae]OLY92148.1 DNA-binding protein [Cnuella takakiae]SHF23541.1 cold-shock DNA-binding protein family [Cnuella takakiae]
MAKSKASFSKREKEAKRQKQRKEKQEKMEERKASAGKGKPLESMMAYIDENGNLSDTPPDPSKMKVFNAEDIQIGVPQHEDDEDDGPLTGKVAFFNHDKGFGFINFGNNGERVFVHVSQLSEPVNENDSVTFEVENGPRGLTAINVRKV